jgi:hypothetical protein
MLVRKRVFIDDCVIGEAATWEEVRCLLRARGIWFINAARGAEGPTGFFLTGTAITRRPVGPRQIGRD